ncbi:MAG: DUF2225 domain-containing protein [Clostridiales bacterium]|nr:DUF2225 domain-containing protein [Clostridiales bacterium]
MGETFVDTDYQDYIYDKKYTCPCCDKDFMNPTVRTSKLRFVRQDTDLRNVFEPFDPIYYDAIQCPHCGYAAMSAYFGKLTDKQIERVEDYVTKRYKHKAFTLPIDAETAVTRTKFALLAAVILRRKDSEKANICLKLSWLYNDIQDAKNEELFRRRSLTTFAQAYQSETASIGGLDSYGAAYLIADLYHRLGEEDEAMKWLSAVITSRDAKHSIKEKARNLKETISGAASPSVLFKSPAAAQAKKPQNAISLNAVKESKTDKTNKKTEEYPEKIMTFGEWFKQRYRRRKRK